MIGRIGCKGCNEEGGGITLALLNEVRDPMSHGQGFAGTRTSQDPHVSSRRSIDNG